MPDTSARHADAGRKLVIVSGSGRSGTSTVAGTLKLLGLTVPPPEVKADSTNPRGFFEPRWVVDFHKQWLKRAGVQTLDARPEAVDIAAEVGARPKPRATLTEWLGAQFTEPQVVVKDPRTFWFRDLWRDAAESAQAEVTYLTMLRHPAEVIGSRDTHYLKNMSADKRLARETGHLAGWINVVLVNELATRGRRRAFIEYPALIESWRDAMGVAADRLELRFNTDLADGSPHPVDDFIDSDLRRVRLTWDDLHVPGDLRDLADHVWQGLLALAKDPDDVASLQLLDEARATYHEIHSQAMALTHDARAAAVRQARMEARQATRRKLAAQARPEVRPSSLPDRLRRRAARTLRRLPGAR